MLGSSLLLLHLPSMNCSLRGEPASEAIYVEDISMASAADELTAGDAVLRDTLEQPTHFLKAAFEDEHIEQLGSECRLTCAYMHESID